MRMRWWMAAVLAALMVLAASAMLTGCEPEGQGPVYTYGDPGALGRDLRDGTGPG